MASDAGKVYVRLVLDDETYKQKLSEDIKNTEATAQNIAKVWNFLGSKTDEYYNNQIKGAKNALTYIQHAHESTYNDIFRAQSAMTAKINAMNQEMVNPMKQMWETLGIKSQASIQAQKSAIISSFDEIKKSGTATQQDLINLEKAKNEKLKALNKEMVGDHEMSMAAMTRAVLRFYAAWYIGSSALIGIKDLFMGGVEAIENLKTSTIATAAIITSMQKGTGDIAQNYKNNLVYSEALNRKLMEIDANTAANLDQLQRMNQAAVTHGVTLDINNKKQVDAYTSISNAVAFMTRGQDQDKQYSQEINALTEGRVKDTDRVAKNIDAIIKQEGKYKNGLKELVAEGKKHGDTWERLAPYFAGFQQATGDIAQSWSAASSSMETALTILKQDVFRDFYNNMISGVTKLAQYIKDNSNTIKETIESVWDTLKAGIIAATIAVTAFGTASVIAAMKAGSAMSSLRIIWDQLTTAITLNTSKMLLAWTAFSSAIIGWEIGSLLNKFESVRIAGVYMVYGLIDAWNWFTKLVEKTWAGVKAVGQSVAHPFSIANITANLNKEFTQIDSAYAKEKTIRDKYRKEQLAEQTDAAIAKAKRDAAKALEYTVPQLKGGDSVGKASKARADNFKDETQALSELSKQHKDFYQEQIEAADHAAKIAQRNGQYEITTINNLYNEKEQALKNYLEVQKQEAAEEVALEAKKVAEKNAVAAQNAANSKNPHSVESQQYDAKKVLTEKLKTLDADYSKNFRKLEDQREDAIYNASQKELQTKASVYSQINQFSEESHQAQIALWNQEVIAWKNAGVSKENISLLLQQKELKWQQDKLTNEINIYSQIDSTSKKVYDLKMQRIEAERKANALRYGEEIANILKIREIQKVDSDLFFKQNSENEQAANSLISSFRTMGEVFKENSKERQIMHNLEMAATIAEIAIQAQKNLMIAVGAVVQQGTGDPYTAFARIAAMIAVVSGILSIVGIAFNARSSSGVSSTTTYTGKSTVLGAADDVASESVNKSYELLQDTYDMQYSELEDLNQSMTELNGNITGLVSSIIRTGNINGNFNINTDTEYPSWWVGISKSEKWTGIGIVDTMLGWIQDLGLGIMNGLFGGKTSTEIQETGIALGMTGTIRNIMDGAYNINPYEYAITKTTKDGGWFGSDSESYSAYTQAASEQVTSLFRKVFINMSSSLVELAKAFGTDVNDVMNYAFENFQINLRGMSGEEINRILSAKFSEMMDTAVSQLFGNIVKRYQQVGEGIYETAVRLVTDKAIVSEIIKKTNQTLPSTTAEVIALSESLISLAGDLETLQDSFAAYYDKFFTDAEKHANLLVDLYDTMSQMNYILPASREGYRQLVESIDTTTESGQRAFVALLGLASYADEYYSYLEDQTKSNLDDAFDAEKERLNAAYDAELEILNTRLSDANDVVSSLTASVNKLRQARDAMNLVDEVYARGMYKYSMASLAGILDAARGGDISGVDTMDNIISILTGDNTKYYSNKIDYSRDYWKTYSALNELGDIVGDQLTDAEKQVELLESQIDILKTNHDSELAMLEAQYNVLIGINTSVMSLADAIAAYKSAQSSSSSAATSGLSATETAINGLYQAYLGRNAEAAGLAFYSNELASGLTLSNIAYQIKNSPEYKSLHGYDLGGIASGPETGYEATLHGTELVVSPKNSYPATVKSNVVSNEEFQAMRKSLEEIKLELSKINKNTANTDNTLKTVSRGGRAFQTEAFA